MRRPHAQRGGSNVIPRALMLQNARPRIAPDKYDDQQEEQPQEIDVDRTDAFVTFVVRLENSFDTEHIFVSSLRGAAGTSATSRVQCPVANRTQDVTKHTPANAIPTMGVLNQYRSAST